MLCFGFSTAGRFLVHAGATSICRSSQINVIWPSVVNGIAISFIFVPLTTATMSQLGQAQIGNASGLYNLMRNLGGSIGIAFVTTMLARGAQTHQALMVGHLTPTDPAFAQRLRRREKSAGAPHRLRDRDAAGLQRHVFAAGSAGASVGVRG